MVNKEVASIRQNFPRSDLVLPRLCISLALVLLHASKPQDDRVVSVTSKEDHIDHPAAAESRQDDDDVLLLFQGIHGSRHEVKSDKTKEFSMSIHTCASIIYYSLLLPLFDRILLKAPGLARSSRLATEFHLEQHQYMVPEKQRLPQEQVLLIKSHKAMLMNNIINHMRTVLTKRHRRNGRIRTTALHSAIQRSKYCQALGLAARLIRRRNKTKNIFHCFVKRRKILTHALCTALTLSTATLEHLAIAANVQYQCQEYS